MLNWEVYRPDYDYPNYSDRMEWEEWDDEGREVVDNDSDNE